MKLKQLKQSFHGRIHPRVFCGHRRIIADDAVAQESMQYEYSAFRYRRPKRMVERKLYDWDFADDRHRRSICRLSWKDRSRVNHQWQRHYEKEDWGLGSLWCYKYRKLINFIMKSNGGNNAAIRLSERGSALEYLLNQMALEDESIRFEYLREREYGPATYVIVHRFRASCKN